MTVAPEAPALEADGDEPQLAKRTPRPLWLHKPRAKHLWPLAVGGAVAWFAEPTPASLAAGVPLVLLGVGVRVWAAGHLVKKRVLSVSGPYAHLRHPCYAGALAVLIGLLICAGPRPALGIPLLLAAFFLHYLPRKERKEAEQIVERHGDAARAYLAAVPALRPRLRPWRPERDDVAEPRSWSLACFRENSEMGILEAIALALTVLVWWAIRS